MKKKKKQTNKRNKQTEQNKTKMQCEFRAKVSKILLPYYRFKSLTFQHNFCHVWLWRLLIDHIPILWRPRQKGQRTKMLVFTEISRKKKSIHATRIQTFSSPQSGFLGKRM